MGLLRGDASEEVVRAFLRSWSGHTMPHCSQRRGTMQPAASCLCMTLIALVMYVVFLLLRFYTRKS
jgi:hypothetical protein